MAKTTTIKERYEKARRKEKAIHLIEEKGVDIETAFSRCGLKLSRFSYPPIRARYKQHGLEVLLERRGGAHAVKVSEDIKHYIRSVKEEDSTLTAGDICQLVQKRFSLKVHFSHMSRILRRMGLNGAVGRPRKKEKSTAIAIDHAGSFVLKAASVAMGLADSIVEVIGQRIKEINSQRSKYAPAFMRMHILSSRAQVLRQKIETLLMMPVFGMERIWHFKTVYPRKGLGLVTGSGTPYKYHTMDNFLRELPRLDIDQSLSQALARCYVEAFDLSFKTKEERVFYIDCFRKVVWTKNNIPKGLHATRNRVMKCLDVYFIHDAQGHPLLPLTRPGDSYLGDALFPLIEALEQAVGHEVVEFAIFDREGLSVAVFQQFSQQKRCFVTMLKENQYQSPDDFDRPGGSRWTTYKKDSLTGKVAEQVLDCDKVLIHSQSKESYKIRAILVRQVGDEGFAVVATNINREQEPDAGKVVDQYRARWELQENSFKQMKPSLYLDSNHGTKGIAQEENRVLQRQVKSLEQKITAKEKKIATTLIKLEQDQQRVLQLEQRINRDESPIKDSEQYKGRIIRKEKIKATVASSEHILKTHQSHLDTLKQKQQALDPTELLYDIDTRKDHIMTNLETALNNADLFVKEHYLPKRYRRADFRTIRDILYRQPGELLESNDEIRVT
ncbi:MAG: hypothetical protein V3T23_10130, partial [Nitrososphaerales archaeon]